ncbi:MAG: DNA mismatch repair protein MutS [Firmicutes bacterium]|nr:DNA mismatch repair protein MutS [Bacillota bacterium]
MMRQYQRVKAAHPDCLVFFRLGDFYEMFFEDAEVGARELEITLTSRTTGAGRRVPMCGVPYHAAESYVSRLVEKGYKVALCDQVEDPRQAKGLVRREVVRVVTPGTVLDVGALPEKANNFIVAVAFDRASGGLGLAALDYSTGEFRTQEFVGEDSRARFADTLACLDPAETVVQPSVGEDPGLERLLGRLLRHPPTPHHEGAFRVGEARRVLLEHFGVVSLEAFGCADRPLAVSAAGALLAYLRETGVGTLEHVRTLRTETGGEVMVLDPATRRNLELVEPIRPGPGGIATGGRGKAGTLLGVLDFTVTAAGGRLLRSWVLHPLTGLGPIRRRQAAVAELAEKHLLRDDLRSALRRVHDLERLVARAAAGTAGARDLLAVRDSLAVVPEVRASLAVAEAPALQELASTLDPATDLVELIGRALVDDPPAALRDGGLIRPSYSAEIDELRETVFGGKSWISRLEAEERERTGIRSLKVGYSQVFGYYIEVTRPNLAAVPPEYERRQTLANAERFVTPGLKAKEALILGAEERLQTLEYEIFCEVRGRVASQAARLQTTARALAELDALLSLAEAGSRYGYCRPEVVEEPGLDIRGGRHPVVERLQGGEEFVPNDCRLGGGEPFFAVITGPNMAGKSTYCRQVALIVLLAQVGSLVPARSARVGLVDRIFTRIGASDDLAGGRSTFLVEMSETAHILHHATPRSLVILDEIGRGTSTYDGLSLAWAVAEHIVTAIGALTLFATHYHELTELQDVLPGVANYCVTVREVGEDIVFLRRVTRGAVDRSYGIQVARLAGLPGTVIQRAREVLHDLEARAGRPQGEARRRVAGAASEVAAARQLALFESGPSPVEREIADLDLLRLTPLEALNLLHTLQERVRREGRDG